MTDKLEGSTPAGRARSATPKRNAPKTAPAKPKRKSEPPTVTEHVYVGKTLAQFFVLRRQFFAITAIELSHGIKFSMATARSIRPNAFNSACPIGPNFERCSEVAGMGAVNHIISWRGVRCTINSVHCI